MRRLAAAVLVLTSICYTGCGSSEQTFPTYAVRGKVVSKATGQPLTEGSVEFVHKEDPRFNCIGQLDKEGSFTLHTIDGSKKLEGAATGEYTVIVRRPMGANQVQHSITLKQFIKVKAEPNTIVLELDQMP
jgi:hypothetical protein